MCAYIRSGASCTYTVGELMFDFAMSNQKNKEKKCACSLAPCDEFHLSQQLVCGQKKKL